MTLESIAISGFQAVLGLVGLIVGGMKVTGQEDQTEAFQRYGYPQWFRIVTGIVEVTAGVALVAGILWTPGLALAGGVLLSAVMAGAIVTHLRIGDPVAKIAVPAILFIAAIALLTRFTFPVS